MASIIRYGLTAGDLKRKVTMHISGPIERVHTGNHVRITIRKSYDIVFSLAEWKRLITEIPTQ